jgi:ribosome-associated protein
MRVVSEPIVVTETVRVPGRALSMRAVRSSGPGGQNVNKVASKIDLRVDLDAIEGLSDRARARMHALVVNRLDADGRLVVTSQESRDQSRNLEIAREKVRRLVASALREPRVRRATRPSAAARERRIEGKKQRSSLKRSRGRPEME